MNSDSPHASDSPHSDEPLYNSRLIRNYVAYVREFHPRVHIDTVLADSRISSYELEDQGHWFSQLQVERFHERLVHETGDRDISRKVGRYAASSHASGVLRQYTLGFMSPSAAYWVMERIAPHLTRACTVKTRKLKSNKFEVTFTPKPGLVQRPYQCENLIGHLEALPRLFTKKYAQVDHPVCIHKGGDRCLYLVTFDKTPFFLWREWRRWFILLGLLACLGFSVLGSSVWMSVFLIIACLYVGISYHLEHSENIELVRNCEAQRETAELLLDQINIRYNEAQLIKEIGQATTMMKDVQKIVEEAIHSIEKRLDFDRGGIWLANRERTHLIFSAGFGHSEEIRGLLTETSFHLDNPLSKGVAVQAFREQKSFLVNDLGKLEREFSGKSLDFIRKTGTQSFICVPLVCEGLSLGVLLVDNLKCKRLLSESDISLLMGIATQIAISIQNAISYRKLQASKEREQRLRKLFERYVPAPVIRRHVDSTETDLFKGEELPISVLFLDIRDFTSSSEKMEAKDLVSSLNSYFEKCSVVVSQGRGHINKYTGDGFLALFGAPEPLEDHARHAFETACGLLELTGDFVLGGRPMELGIGIHEGKAILGNIGSQMKIEYTAIGDTVNTAARLQEFTRRFDQFPIIMSRVVWESLKDHPCHANIRLLGRHKVRGKKESFEAFGFNPLYRTSSGIQRELPLPQRVEGA